MNIYIYIFIYLYSFYILITDWFCWAQYNSTVQPPIYLVHYAIPYIVCMQHVFDWLNSRI